MLHGGKRLGRYVRLQRVGRSQWPVHQRQEHQLQQQQQQQRGLLTLAIETSCDDTAVAILETTGSLCHQQHHHRRHRTQDQDQDHHHQLSHPSTTPSHTNNTHASSSTSIHHDASNKDNNSSSHDYGNSQNGTTTKSKPESHIIDSLPPPHTNSPTTTTSNKQTANAVRAKILFHEKITARNTGHGGIHPLEALESHQANLATLVSKALAFLPDANAATKAKNSARTFRYRDLQRAETESPTLSQAQAQAQSQSPDHRGRTVEKVLPDFVTVTRGPGMRSNLACGIDTAKGLAAAWQVPLVGVHHMQAHALTPRLVDALERESTGVLKEQEQEQADERKQGRQQQQRQQWKSLEGVVDEDCVDVTQSQSNSLPTTNVSKIEDHIQMSQQLGLQMQPQFPFLTLLVSGGHTMLLYSKGLIDHRVVASTRDIAIGDALDKCGRVVLPDKVKSDMQDTAYAKYLSEWVSTTSQSTELWPVPQRRQSEIDKPENQFGWQVQAPLADTKDMAFSFTGIATSIEKLFRERENSIDGPITDSERLMFARTALGISFEHLGSRTIIALETLRAAGNDISTLVVSGGVAANSFLRLFLRAMLDIRGFKHVELLFPPPWLCTDNAVMIAWSGMEMFEAGYQSQSDIRALRKWSMDPTAADGGILGVGGWR